MAALLVGSATDAGAAQAPDAEIYAASATEVITDPADPRLDVRLVGFRQEMARIIRRGGGRPSGSALLYGVFLCRELRAIADTVRQRFHQQSAFTFDYPDRRSDPVDAVRLESRESVPVGCGTASRPTSRRASA